MTDSTTAVPPAATPPGGPTPKTSSPLVPLLIIGAVAVVVLGVAALFVISAVAGGGGGSDPGERAQEYIQAYHDNDVSKVRDLIIPAQREQIDEAVWEECGYDRLDKSDDGSDPDDPDATVETVYVDEEGIFTNDVPGAGARQYPAVSATVQATSDDGEFREFEVDLLKDDGQWYVRLSAEGGPASQNDRAMAACE